MKSFTKTLAKITGLLMLVALVITACKRTYDEPPGGDPDIKTNTTIAQLQKLYTGNLTTISTDVVFAGVVVGDDKSGNIYKQIYIQDSTGGIAIQIDASNINANFPVGRKVFVKAKGLTLGTYGGMIELGLGTTDNIQPARIPQSLMTTYMTGGSVGNVVIPAEVNIKDLNSKYVSTLVKLKGVQVQKADLNKTWADTSLQSSAVNINIEDCSSGKAIIRTSSYASFAGLKVAQGKGDLLGIYTTFNGTGQIIIRDTTDVSDLKNIRCDGSTPGGGGTGTVVKSIADLRALYKGSDVGIATGSTITGTVVSSSTNEASGNYRIAQSDNAAGVILYLSPAPATPYAVGTELQINLNNSTLTAYNGDLEVTGVTLGNVITASTSTVPPRIATVSAINANRFAWSSTMATINNVTIAKTTSNTTGQNYSITDATGNLVTFVRTASGIALAEGTATSITGYVSVFKSSTATDTTTQLTLRSLADVTGFVATNPGGGGTTTGSLLGTYTFASITTTSGTTDPTAVPTATGMTFGSFTANGVSANPNASGRFSFTTWPTGATDGSDAFTGQIDVTKYYEVTFTPGSGKKLQLDSLTFSVQRSGTGVRQWAVRSSLDNYGTNLAASVTANANISVVATNLFQITDATTTAQSGPLITLPAASYGNLTAPVTFRFYATNAEGTGGTFSLNKVGVYGAVK